MSFKECEFPFCDHNSFDARINSHHITPKSQNGINHSSNIFCVCPNHHSAIYVEGEKTGIHGKKLIGNGKVLSGSIIIIKKLTTTKGKALLYFDCSENKNYIYYYVTRENHVTDLSGETINN